MSGPLPPVRRGTPASGYRVGTVYTPAGRRWEISAGSVAPESQQRRSKDTENQKNSTIVTFAFSGPIDGSALDIERHRFVEHLERRSVRSHEPSGRP